jgi:1-phosphofructokinase
MIVTVTPNPSIDRTIRIEHLERGALHRATSATAEAVEALAAVAAGGVEGSS